MFSLTLRPGCIQYIVMKGSSQAVEAHTCACQIFPEREGKWKEGLFHQTEPYF